MRVSDVDRCEQLDRVALHIFDAIVESRVSDDDDDDDDYGQTSDLRVVFEAVDMMTSVVSRDCRRCGRGALIWYASAKWGK